MNDNFEVGLWSFISGIAVTVIFRFFIDHLIISWKP